MPSFSNFNISEYTKGSFFSKYTDALNLYTGDKYLFHVGDIKFDNKLKLNIDDHFFIEDKYKNKYLPPKGIPELIEILLQKKRPYKSNHVGFTEDLAITPGGGGAVAIALSSIAEKEDEIIILSPHWPLIPGILRTLGVKPLFIDIMIYNEQAGNLLIELKKRVTEKTVAIYINSPCNPTGNVLSSSLIYELADIVINNDLWVISDNAYTDFFFIERPVELHDIIPERTLVAYSFSKSFGIPETRCGYLFGPDFVISKAIDVLAHLTYGVPLTSQLVARSCLLSETSSWRENEIDKSKETGKIVSQILGTVKPEGAIYIFLNISKYLRGRNVQELFAMLLENGVLVSPGTIFGNYTNYIRLCFSTNSRSKTIEGVIKMNNLLNNF